MYVIHHCSVKIPMTTKTTPNTIPINDASEVVSKVVVVGGNDFW